MKIADQWLINLITAPGDDAQEKPRWSLILSTDDSEQVDPSWSDVEAALVAAEGFIRDDGGEAYGRHCILAYATDPQDYIQAAHWEKTDGRMAWRLEKRNWHSDGTWTHCYARVKGNDEGADTVTQGEPVMVVEEAKGNSDGTDTVADLSTVIAAFWSFYYGRPLPSFLTWTSFTVPRWI